MISCQKCLALRFSLRVLRVPALRPTKHFLKSSPRCILQPVIRNVGSNVTYRDAQPAAHYEVELEEDVADALNLTTNPYISHQELDEPHQEFGELLQELDEPKPSSVAIKDALEQPTSNPESKKGSKTKKKKVSDSEVSRHTVLTESEQMKKEAAHRQNLICYLAACMRQGTVYKAYSILMRYHKEEKYAVSSEVYDVVLKEAAVNGNWGLIEDIKAMMKQKNVPLSHDSFMACFICLGARYATNTEKWAKSSAKTVIEEMRTHGYTVDDLFEKCKFTDNQRDMALKAVRYVVPGYVPTYRPVELEYVSPLLTKLNDRKVDETMESPASGIVDNNSLSHLGLKQLHSEMNGIMEIKSISTLEETDKVAIREIEQLEKTWEVAIRQAVIRDVKVCQAKFATYNNKKIHIYPFLASLDTEDHVRILMQEVKMLSRISDLFSPSMYVFCTNLGFRVMSEARLLHKTKNGQIDKFRTLYQKYLDWYLEPTRHGMFNNPRQMWQQLLLESKGQGADLDVEEVTWPFPVIQSIGQFLYNIILSNLKITDAKGREASAYYVVFRTKGVRTCREIKPHPNLVKLYLASNKKKLYFDPALLPMLSPPLPWHGFEQGGYLVTSVPMVRLHPLAQQQRKRIETAPPPQLYPAFDALNAVGSIPWKINNPILSVAIKVFNSKGSKELNVPQPPSELPPPPTINPSMTRAEKAQIHKEKVLYKRTKSEMYSLWCDTLYKLSLANHFKKTIFWLPHNMDFRGRVYPCSPHLTHLSHDLARSLLMFGKGKPLGKNGFEWLKLHVVNLTGFKKREPISERYRYVEEIMPEILDSAERPLSGRRWWVSSDEPWQTLAACMEVAQALKCPEGPEAYVSHLPVHQDGSCNGLQHYAALGRDQIGAESVNLTPSESPQDVYSSVAVLVERERAKDAANGVEIAKLLEGHINRKVIKQTVMTTVYGVTRFGAKLQIVKQLKEIPEFPQDFLLRGGGYLADKTFLSLQEMFTSAKEIQDWFTDSAKLISTAVGKNVEWLTPLGFPVVQYYSKNPGDPNSRPNVMKQRNAFPPNFIHSLDSSHMMLTALFCQRQGTTFASIHDCFWTHPCTVDKMNKACREQFVSLHSQPILEDLSKFMVTNFGGDPSDFAIVESPKQDQKLKLNQVLSEVPRRGSYDLNQVLDSVYFFS